MKKIIAVVLLSVVVAAPSFADDATAKAPVKKSPAATVVPPVNDRSRMRQKCDVESVAGAHRGYGMMGPQGAGMMMEPGIHMFRALSLSEEQRSKISKLSDELKHDNWAKQGLINDETAKLRDLYEADKRDPAAIGREYQKIFDLKRQMIEAYIDTQNRIDEIMTPEQRAQMKAFHNKMHPMYMHPVQ
jgi:Spy/CpxP family protein refolding chaperone